MANALANLASTALYPCHMKLNIMAHPSIHNATIYTIKTKAYCSWISPISSYLRSETLLEDKGEAVNVKARVAIYALLNDVLYKRSFFRSCQRCLQHDEEKCIIEQIHRGIFGTHVGRRSLCIRIMTLVFADLQ